MHHCRSGNRASPIAQTIATRIQVIWCASTFFLWLRQSGRARKKNKLPRFFSVTPLARSGRLFFVPCGAMASRHTKKKYLHEAHGHLKFCGGPAWPWPCFLSALHPRGVPPRPHTRHGGAVAFARVGLRTYRLAPAFSAFACYFLRI